MSGRTGRAVRQLWSVAVAVGLLVLVTGGPARADSAGPTDYSSTVTAVEPATPTVDVQIVGGDSFILMTVEPGTTVEVAGYQGEPYLRVAADGTVERNRRSPATFLNEDRYGTDVPAEADAEASPDWERVATGGRYAWHDHRGHWMAPEPPDGAESGDVVQVGVVPLVVDGSAVEVTIETRYVPGVSVIPGVIGVLAGAVAVAAAIALGLPFAALVIAAVAGAIVGIWQYRSLPGETGPQWTWWVLPVAALVVAVSAVLIDRGRTERPGLERRLVAGAAAALAAAFLVVWVVQRRLVLSRSVLPTDAPFALDRAVTTFVAVVAVAVGAVALSRLVFAPKVTLAGDGSGPDEVTSAETPS